jgi:hypothetical protein
LESELAVYQFLRTLEGERVLEADPPGGCGVYEALVAKAVVVGCSLQGF